MQNLCIHSTNITELWSGSYVSDAAMKDWVHIGEQSIMASIILDCGS